MKDDKTGRSEQSDQALYAPTASRRDAGNVRQFTDQNPDTQSDTDPGEGADDDQAPALSADMQRFIGRQLRAVYDDVAKQPVPDRFLELMRQLESKTAAG